MELKVGMTYQYSSIATPERSARAMGSGGLPVFATPALVAMMECACYNCVKEAVPEGSTTVGTALNIKHLSATPEGMNITAECELIEIDRRRLTFRVAAFDECGKIGEGTHERFIVDVEKFMENANFKGDKE